MKKLVLGLLMVVSFYSCSSDNDSASSTDNIVGKWKVVSYSSPENYEPCDYLGYINIMDGGKYQDYDECTNTSENGTWSQKDNMLTITSPTFLFTVVGKIVSVSNTTLVLEFNFIGTHTTTYKRI
jgi:hypothetical protein